MSLQESDEAKATLKQNQEAVGLRLAELNRERCDTLMDGICQFVALCFSPGIPIQHRYLFERGGCGLHATRDRFLCRKFQLFCRCQIVFKPHGRRGSYGDDCTLQCAAPLFLRKIKVVCANPGHDREFNPAEAVSPNMWGPGLSLAFAAWNHYEATAPIFVS